MAVLPSISLSFDVKKLFFDRDRVTKFMDGQTRRALQEAGRRIRRIAQTSMRYVTSRKEQERKIAAGLRKRARIEADREKMSVSSAINALKMAEVVVLTLDAVEGVNDQDLQIARLVEREGRACVIALNKWDAVPDRNAARKAATDRLEESLAQMKGIPVVTFSALTGAGIDRLLPAVRAAHAVWNTRVPTGELNRWFERVLARHPPPMVSGRRLKLRYLTQAKARPPTFIVFGTRAERIPEDYQRYLVNNLRETFELPGTPIRMELRGTKNPFADD